MLRFALPEIQIVLSFQLIMANNSLPAGKHLATFILIVMMTSHPPLVALALALMIDGHGLDLQRPPQCQLGGELVCNPIFAALCVATPPPNSIISAF